MITKTTNLSDEYFSLFDEIEAKGGPHIENLESFFGSIQEIAAIDKKFLRLPLDEPMFEIDANTRKINIPQDFKSNGLSVQGDHLAETLFFKIDKYFDYMDLMNADIYINWKIGAESGSSECFIKSDNIEPGYIIFGWPIADVITGKSGALSFAVQFVIKNDDGIAYNFNTIPTSGNIKEGLVLLNPEVYDMENNILAILSNSSFGEGSAAVDPVEWIRGSGLINDLFNGTFTPVVNLESVNDGGMLASVPVDYFALAGSGNDAVINYFDKNKAPVASEFVAVPSGTELNDKVIYYISNGDGSYNKASQAQLDVWGTEEEVELFVNAVKVVLTGKGEYFVNAQGVKKDEEGNKIGASEVKACATVIVPSAETPSAVEVEVPEYSAPEGYVIADGSKTVFIAEGSDVALNAKAIFDEGGDDFGLLEFTWYKDGAPQNMAEFANANNSELTITEEGEYKVAVRHFRNGDTTSAKESEAYTASYLASPIVAELEGGEGQIINLNKATSGGFVSGNTAIIKTNYSFADEMSTYSDVNGIKFDLVTADEETAETVIPAAFASAGEGVESCTINSANIAEEGYFRIKVSNNYNGSIYSVYSDKFYININMI